MNTVRLIAIAAGFCAGLLSAATPALAQGAADGAALLEAGNKALKAGEYKNAARQFARAMRSDTLSTEEIAKALVLRGVAHRNADQPAQAIADITSALWLQGLSNADLAKAYATRGLAYKDVGLSSESSSDLRKAREIDPNSQAIAEASRDVAPTVSAFRTEVQEERRPQQAARVPGFSTNVSRAPAPRAQPAPVPSFRTQVKTAERKPEPIPSFRTSIVPDERPAPRPARPEPKKAAPPKPWSTSTSVAANTPKPPPARWNTNSESSAPADAADKPSGTVSGFFSNLWGGGDKKEEPAAAPPPPQPATGQWTQSTRVASAPARPAAPRPAAAPPRPAAPSASGGARTYRVQLAALRSDAEAQSTWQRLSRRHQSLLAGQEHIVEKTTLGDLGTYYRIQIGPFTDKQQSAQLCKSLKSSGVDCFVVAR